MDWRRTSIAFRLPSGSPTAFTDPCEDSQASSLDLCMSMLHTLQGIKDRSFGHGKYFQARATKACLEWRFSLWTSRFVISDQLTFLSQAWQEHRVRLPVTVRTSIEGCCRFRRFLCARNAAEGLNIVRAVQLGCKRMSSDCGFVLDSV